ncbi:Tolllike receptor 7, partial [Caligus rogercresseyi]
MFISVLLMLLGISPSVIADCQFTDERSLNCFLRTLQTDLGAPSASLSAALKLRITCSDIFFFESIMRSEHF